MESNFKGVELEILRVRIPGKCFEPGDAQDSQLISLPLAQGDLGKLKEMINGSQHINMFGSTETDDSNAAVLAFGFSNDSFNVLEAVKSDKIFGFTADLVTLNNMAELIQMLIEHLEDEAKFKL